MFAALEGRVTKGSSPEKKLEACQPRIEHPEAAPVKRSCKKTYIAQSACGLVNSARLANKGKKAWATSARKVGGFLRNRAGAKSWKKGGRHLECGGGEGGGGRTKCDEECTKGG